MSQNQTQWNLDFRFHLGTLFQESIIQLYVISNEHKPDRHFFEQKYECTGMDASITSSNKNPMCTTYGVLRVHVQQITTFIFSKLMSQNHTHWNLDFRLSLGTLSKRVLFN